MIYADRFKDQIAIVTGGAQGIGFAAAQRFAAEGATVVIADINKDVAEKAAEELNSDGGKAVAEACDVSDYASTQKLISGIAEKFGRIDILVNNAGITRDKIFHKMSFEQWETVIKTNLTGTFNMTSNVIGIMREQKYGRIVNLSSTAVYGSVGQTNYSASKAGIIGMTKTLAKETAKHGITVNAVLPEFTETAMVKQMPPDVLEELLKNVPIGRPAKTEEQAAAICFLASREASFITGATLDVNGGAF